MSRREVDSVDALDDDTPTLYWTVEVTKLREPPQYRLEVDGTAPHATTGEATDYSLSVTGEFDEKPTAQTIDAHKADIITKMRAANVLGDGEIQTFTIHSAVTDQ